MRIRSVLSWLVFIAVSAALVLSFSNLQAISDWLELRNYQPGSRIVQLADETTMKDGTRRVFYINHPELDAKQDFNGHCRTTEQTIVLGCFIDGKGIYLLEVTDSRLDGVVEVTAAHEALHAMYARLGKSEKEKVDRMTADFFATLKDERIKKTIESYRTRDPSVVPNELHSILGTEVRSLSPELENYYKTYFKDRAKIVDYSDRYEKAFVDIEAKAKDYDGRLAELKRTIDSDEAQINAKAAEIDARQRELESLRAAGEISEYNRQVPLYNSEISEYNALVNQAKQEINQYNELLTERNRLVTQQQELYKVINSNSVNVKSSK